MVVPTLKRDPSYVDQLSQTSHFQSESEAFAKNFLLVSICPLPSLLLMHIGSRPDTFPTAMVPSIAAVQNVFTRLELAEERWHCWRQSEMGHGRPRKNENPHERPPIGEHRIRLAQQPP